jgi:hypothetical protein
LGIALLSLAGVAVAATAYADGPPFGFDFNKPNHDKDCSKHCVVGAPEIDPASALGALTLLGGGLLVLRGWSKKK